MGYNALRGFRLDLEAPDQHITLRRASQISGLAYPTLKAQAKARGTMPAKLRVERLGPRTVLTTRRWLHEYLTAASERDKGARKPLPQGYVAPE